MEDFYPSAEQANKKYEAPKLIWAEKYRPTKLSDIIMPEKLNNAIRYAIDNNEFPNVILHSGKPGTGKTTTATVIPMEQGCDFRVFVITKKSMEIISEIEDYAMGITSNGKPRYVILDEADMPSDSKFYTSLQPLIESSSHTLRFILTLNNLHKIPEPVRSRCIPISFSHNDNNVKKRMYKRLLDICVNESGGIQNVETETIKIIAKSLFPDMRAILTALQFNFLENCGKISGVPNVASTSHVQSIYEYILKKDDVGLRHFVNTNVTDYQALFPMIGYFMIDKIENQSIRLSVYDDLSEHQYRSALPSIDQEINLNGFCLKMMRKI